MTGAHPSAPRATAWWRIAGPPAVLVMVVLALTASRYGFHGDELYVRMLPAAWWYDDQPPLTVWLAHLTATVSDAVAVHRLPAVLAAGVGVVVAAQFPRIAGHGVRAQRLAAWAHAFTVYPLLMGHVLLTASLDLLAWQLVLLGVVAALCGRRHGLAWAGVAAGVACWNKLLVLALVAAILLALLVCARRLLRTADAGVGALAVVAIGGFQVGAQLVHGLPMLDVSGALVATHGTLNRLLVVPLVVVFLGPPLAPVWWRGLFWRARRSDGPVLAVVAAVLVAFNLASPAQPYYAVAAFLPALALGWGRAAAVRAEVWRVAPRVIVANGVVAALLCLPLVPVSSPAFTVTSTLDPVARDQVGWPGYAHQIAHARAGATAIVTGSYALAGALVRHGARDGVRREDVASTQTGLGSLGPPSGPEVLLVGRSAPRWRVYFARCEDAGALVTAGADAFDVVGTPMVRCSGPLGGWGAVWPRLRHDAR